MTMPIAIGSRSVEAAAGPVGRSAPWTAALIAVLAIGAAALPGASHAQSSLGEPAGSPTVDQRWLPWLGCWQLVEETGARPEAAGDLSAFANRVLVCVTPAAPPASATDVVVTTLADGEQVLVETLSADAMEHPVDQSECRGRRRITWSEDGARLFTRAELTCSARNDARRLSAVGLMADGRTWLALELVEAGERAAVTVRRYRRAGDVATLGAAEPTLTPDLLARARTAASRTVDADLSIDAVIEAAAAIDPPVLEALLVETGTMFDLDGRTLIRLDDGGVPGNIIDMLVALSFPEDFSVRRSAPSGGGGGGFPGSWGGYGYDAWYPYYAAPFGYYYGWSPYRSLYGWGDYYYLDPYYSGITGAVVSDRPDVGEGRVYEGYGYTRVATPRDDGGRRARPRGTSGGGIFGGGGSSGGSSSGGSSGGGTVSAGGYSSGGSSSSGGGRSGGRTASPRDP
jgi:hypothetical protein